MPFLAIPPYARRSYAQLQLAQLQPCGPHLQEEQVQAPPLDPGDPGFGHSGPVIIRGFFRSTSRVAKIGKSALYHWPTSGTLSSQVADVSLMFRRTVF